MSDRSDTTYTDLYNIDLTQQIIQFVMLHLLLLKIKKYKKITAFVEIVVLSVQAT